ncbi:helix-turn-helix domain-containing protein [Ochrobactrum quorumnocens]|uniref:helix-turn-helix domain-containing protein n=1 Tax=Ochrobactrum quorumnocens TaxID=271865 RepID=UPI0038520730
MIFVPMPFVVALLLLILLVAMWHRQENAASNHPFQLLIALCAVQSVTVGLRWGYGLAEFRYLLPIIASCLPPLAYASFRSLIRGDGKAQTRHLWHIAAFPVAVTVILLAFPVLLDFGLIVLFVGYALALLYIGRTGPDGLDDARFDSAISAHRALVFAAISLCVSAFFDLAVLMDFEWTNGKNAALIVSNANLLGLFFVGLTAMVASRAKPSASAPLEENEDETRDEQERNSLARVEHVLIQNRLYLDENLTLIRLARKVGLPARQISSSINRITGKNVSQYINDYRITEACRLLRETALPVTTIMFESGFQTKSNFNREFRRVTSLSPASWRDQQVME